MGHPPADRDTDFFLVRCFDKTYDVALVNGVVVLARSQDGEPMTDTDWTRLKASAAEWRRADRFREHGAREATLERKTERPTCETVKVAEELIEQIQEMAEQIPGKGEEFAQSCLKRAGDIMQSVEKFGRATEGQLSALRNMCSGLEKWIH